MKKYFILIALFGLVGTVAAGDDCARSLPPKDPKELEAAKNSWLVFEQIMPYSDLEIARSHLLAYCCKEKRITDQTACKNLSSIYPESPYFYDHLIDVGFRRLDVVGAYNVNSVDTLAKDWYTFITQQKDPTAAMTPLTIQQKYQTYWSMKYIPFLQDRQGDWKKNVAAYSKAELTVGDKYINWCYIAKLMYEEVLVPNNWPVEIGDASNGSSYYSRCVSLARERIQKELVFTKTLMLQKSSRTLNDSFKSYALDEFVQNRLMGLLDKVASITQLFTTISKQAPLSAKCSK